MACFDSLVFWCIGYGGWAGVTLIPLIMLYTDSFTVRAMSIVLAPCIGALATVSAVTITYTISFLAHSVFSVMINPVFMNTLCASIPISTSVVSLYLLTNYIHTQEMTSSKSYEEDESEGKDKDSCETDQEGSETSETNIQESDNDQETDVEIEEDSDEEIDNKTVSDAESTDISEPDHDSEPDNTWRDEANFEGLRNAPPIPDQE